MGAYEGADPLVTKEVSLQSVFSGKTQTAFGLVALIGLHLVVGLKM